MLSKKALNSTCRYLGGGGLYLSCTILFFFGAKMIRAEQRAYLNAYAYAF